MLHRNGHVLVHEPEPAGEAADQQHCDRSDPCRGAISGWGGRPPEGDDGASKKNAVATMHPATIHRCVDWSIIGRPCQSSSMIIAGIETARTIRADPTMSAQPGDRNARM